MTGKQKDIKVSPPAVFGFTMTGESRPKYTPLVGVSSASDSVDDGFESFHCRSVALLLPCLRASSLAIIAITARDLLHFLIKNGSTGFDSIQAQCVLRW